jgi:hypothetical protein
LITGVRRSIRHRQDREHFAEMWPVAADRLHPVGKDILGRLLDAVADPRVLRAHRDPVRSYVDDDAGDARAAEDQEN